MDVAFYRDTWAEINLDHIYDNVTAMIKHVPKGIQVCAVVKANAYGHGDVEVAQVALKAGVDSLAVATLDEAIVLRQKGIQAPVLILGAIRPSYAVIAAEQNFSVTVFNNEWLKEAVTYLSGDLKLHVHLKCDTGMARLGYRKKEHLQEAERIVREHESLNLQGVYSHFATADELDLTHYKKQLRCFKELVESLSEKPDFTHFCNSAGALVHQDAWFNGVRMGISMYGLSPSQEIQDILPFSLKPAFSLRTKIVNVKKIEAGETVSYGATYVADEEQWVATLPIGYADGWIRKLGGQSVLIDGRRMPIIGRICMDQCMVKLPAYYPIGTDVTLIGVDGADAISVDEIADKLETINYEVVCNIGRRVPRVYIEQGKIVSVRNELL